MDTALIWNFFLATIAIVNPLGKVPVWLEACEGCESPVRLRLAMLVTGTAAGLLVLFLFFGGEILDFLGIDLPAFRVGGGIIILLVGIDMLRGQAVNMDTSRDQGDDSAMVKAKSRFRDVAVPVAVPILAGPGSITTVMLYGFRADGWGELGLLAGVLAGVMACVFGILMLGDRIRAAVGELALSVQTRIWGLLLTAIAAQLIIVGLGESFPTWLNHSSPIADDVSESQGQ